MVLLFQRIAFYVRVMHGALQQSQGLACEDRMEDTSSDGETTQAGGAKANAESSRRLKVE